MTLIKSKSQIEEKLGQQIIKIEFITSGFKSIIYLLEFETGFKAAIKEKQALGLNLKLEADKLIYLKNNSELRVPEVLFYDDNCLVMEYFSKDRGKNFTENVANDLVNLHEIKAERFGFEYDTNLGPLYQINLQLDSWPEFFVKHRLLCMAKKTYDEQELDLESFKKIENLAEKCLKILPDNSPCLIHGDIWSNNVLADENGMPAYIDPAIYFADPEIELAFIMLFNSFDEEFFKSYNSRKKIDQDFYKVRKDIYNLYPLLVHLSLFGKSYLGQIQEILAKSPATSSAS